ncbi:hypothetical protein [Amaricoccus sp.]
MLTFYHSPSSRSTSVRELIIELGVADQNPHGRGDDPAPGRLGRP